MTAATRKHWLGGICDPGHPRAICHRPYLLLLAGETWTVATDARLVVYLRGEVPPAEHYPAEADYPRFEFLCALAGAAGRERWRGPLADLAAWCGPRGPDEPCEGCGGDGRCECPACEAGHACGCCAGSGKQPPGVRAGVLCGLPVDCNRLALALPHLAAGDVKIFAEANEKPLRVHGDGWRLALAPLGSPAEAGAPRFPEREG